MKTLTDILLDHPDMDDLFRQGTRRANHILHARAEASWAMVRKPLGLKGAPPLLTHPDGNRKLHKAAVPSYGLTLQHYVQKLSTGLTINACPWAGDCTKVCVLDNGYGLQPKVVASRRARTEFLVRHPEAFAFLLGWELSLAKKRDGPRILFRPNVNSDVEWHRVLPSLTNGYLPITSYGYTKGEYVLDTDGWVDVNYRVAYSWNENSPKWVECLDFLGRGGSVAVVTDRRPGDPVRQWAPQSFLDGKVVDADLTDEWIFKRGVIGDLSAKGKARRLIGRSGFVVERGEQ